MPTAHRRAPSRSALVRALLALAPVLALALLPGCDNPACLYGGDCLDDDGGGNGGGNGGGAGAVVFPVDGEWIADAAPRLDAFAPSTGLASTSPLLLRFNESLNPGSVVSAFRIVPAGGGLEPPSTPSTALVGDGRALVLLTNQPLAPGTSYTLEYAENAVLTDLTGTALVKPVSGEAGSFQAASTPSTTPRLAASYPADGATGASGIGEVVLVFDRPIDAATVTTDSVEITVDGAPLSPPPAAPSVLETSSGTAQPRVFTWRYTDALGNPIELPPGALVRFALSPQGGDAIEDAGGAALPATAIQFTVSTLPLPTGARIASEPDDAFGVDHLTGQTPFLVEVDYPEATQEGDALDVLLFGVDVEGEDPDNLFRQRTVAPEAGSSSTALSAEELQLTNSTTPLAPIFADGGVAFAFRFRRAGEATPVRLLDVDPNEPGVQDPLQDTVPPEFVGFGTAGAQADEFRSDQYELAVVGLASEPVRSVEVTATLDVDGTTQTLSNGDLPPVAGSTALGAFVAAPIPGDAFEGLESEAIELGLRVYDRALNPAPDVTAVYVRRGVVGGGSALGDRGRVRVYDASDVLPIAGAAVYLHVRFGSEGGVGGEDVVKRQGPFFTDGDGVALVPVSAQGEVTVTVDADGYDLFSFQGMTTAVLDVPLRASGFGFAVAQGAVTSSLSGLEEFLSRGADSRRAALPPRDPVVEMGCTTDPFTLVTSCITVPDGEFGGYLVGANRLGAFSYFAIESQTGPASFDPVDFIRAFTFGYPRAALPPSDSPQLSSQELEFLLADLGPEETPLAAPEVDLDLSGVTGFVGTPSLRTRVEASSPGVPDPVIVGLAAAYDLEIDQVWDVRGAYPGAVDPIADDEEDALGRLVQSGAVGDTLYLTMQALDSFGNTSTLRAPIAAEAPPAALVPSNVPRLLEPVGNTGAGAFELVLRNVLPEDEPGLYSVLLTESTGGVQGRAWRLWRQKAAGDASEQLVLRAPDLAAAGANTLEPGTWSVVVDVVSAPDLLLEAFAWRELPRRAQRSGQSSPVFLTNP